MQKVSDYKTASAYAQAWFDAAKDKHAEDKTFEETRALKDGIDNISALWAELSRPADEAGVKTEVIASFAKECGLSEVSTEALKLIAENGRLKLTKLILDEYKRLYYEDKGIIEIKAVSAVELSRAQNDKLKKILEKKLAAPVEIEYTVDPAVLGGLAIRYGSFLIDDTIKNKLCRIEQLLEKRQA